MSPQKRYKIRPEGHKSKGFCLMLWFSDYLGIPLLLMAQMLFGRVLSQACKGTCVTKTHIPHLNWNKPKPMKMYREKSPMRHKKNLLLKRAVPINNASVSKITYAQNKFKEVSTKCEQKV